LKITSVNQSKKNTLYRNYNIKGSGKMVINPLL